MRESLTISLPGDSKRLIEEAAGARGLTVSEYVRLAVFRRVWEDALADSRRTAVAHARARGVYTDDEVFRLIS